MNDHQWTKGSLFKVCNICKMEIILVHDWILSGPTLKKMGKASDTILKPILNCSEYLAIINMHEALN